MKCKEGDVLLFKPFESDFVGALVALFSDMGPYCHCAMYTGNHRIIEARPDKGVSTRLLTPQDVPFITPYYLPELSNRDIFRIIRFLMAKVKENTEYDTLGLVPSFLHSVLGKLFGNKEYQKTPSFLNDNKKFFCSDIIGTAFFETLKIEIHPSIHHTNITPNDLAHSLLVRRK